MLSVNAAIRNIRFKNIYAGYRNYAINGDGARYCKTPLFKDEDHPEGVGCIENIEIENFVCYPVMRPSENNSGSLVDPSYGIRLEVGCDNFVVNNFKKLKAPSDEGTHALFMRYVKGQEIITDGERRILRDKSDELVADGFSKLIINKMRG